MHMRSVDRERQLFEADTAQLEQEQQGGYPPLPPIPSQCLMTSQDLQFDITQATSNNTHRLLGRASVSDAGNKSQRPQSAAPGLGISLRSRAINLQASPAGQKHWPLGGQLAAPVSVSDPCARTDQAPRSPQLRSVSNGPSGGRRTPSDTALLSTYNGSGHPGQMLSGADNWNALAKLPVVTDDPFSNLQGFGWTEDFAQSATDNATPTQAMTPDWMALQGGDNNLSRDFRALVDEISHHASDEQVAQTTSPPTAKRGHPSASAGTGQAKPGEHVSPSGTNPASRSIGELGNSRDVELSTEPRPLVQSLQRLVNLLEEHASQWTAYPELAKEVRMHAMRLEGLENASFPNSPVEDVADRIELLDVRVTDVEGTVDELNKQLVLDDDASVDRRRLHRGQKMMGENSVNSSFMSNASGRTRASGVSTSSSALIAAAIDRVELMSRVEALESKVTDIESVAGPSPARPWEVEVIVLPWGRDMRGIWESVDSPMDAHTRNEQWAQPRSSFGKNRDDATAHSKKDQIGWNGETIQLWAEDTGDWKSARACNNRSKVYKRLASRGLVFNVQIIGGTAKDVSDAMMTENGDMIRSLENMANPNSTRITSSGSFSDGGGTMLGLRSPFVPLRKIHKESKLEFLSCEELLTPTLWTVDFLASSVVMKRVGGQRTLFVTHPAGYLQSDQSCGADWTWAKLRQLPRVDHRQSSTEAGVPQVLEANAKESCWEWDLRLDPPVSSYSSFSSLSSCHSTVQLHGTLTEQSLHADVECPPSPTPAYQPRDLPASPMSEFPPDARPHQYARISIEGSQPAAMALLPKRRDVSHDITSPTRAPTKRRRLSRSPSAAPSLAEVALDATPRASRPMSPFFSQAPVPDGGRSQTVVGASNSRRGVTPTAYATPYSGPVVTEQRSRLRKGEGRGPGPGGREGLEQADDHPPWEGLDEGDDGGFIDDSDDGDDDDDASCFSGVDEDEAG
jgi:hypothetical protein